MSSQFVSAYSEKDWIEDAIEDVCEQVRSQVDAEINFLVFFASGYPSVTCKQYFPQLSEKLGTPNVLGCNAEGLIRDNREIEGRKAMTALAANWPVNIEPMRIEYSPQLGVTVEEQSEKIPLKKWLDVHPQNEFENPSNGAFWLLLGEPNDFPADLLLDAHNKAGCKEPIIGGVCSGAFGNESFFGDPRQNSLSVLNLGTNAYQNGAVAFRIAGAQVMPLVSQGCRPIGEPLEITKCERNEIFELAGNPALHSLKQVFLQLSAEDQRLFQESLLIGRVLSDLQGNYGIGDFLIRSLTGVDEDKGTLAASDYFSEGQIIQFQLRDSRTADQDLDQWLRHVRQSLDDRRLVARAGFCFSSNSRGMNLFEIPSHDAAMLQNKIGGVPTTGFFSAGEIGPLQGANYLCSISLIAALVVESCQS